jgi:ketosteroid isomerase-like protein
MFKFSAVIYVMMVFAACTEKPREPQPEGRFNLQAVREAILEANKTYDERLTRRDSAFFVERYTPDAIVMPQGVPSLNGMEAIMDFFIAGQNSGINNIPVVAEEVFGGPEIVVETGTYELIGADGKKLDKGKFIVAWKEEDGKWKIHREIWNGDGPQPKSK